MPRLFTALEIPAEVQQSLAMLRGGIPGARWIDPENYHLTLRFIGDIDDAMAHEIALMLDSVSRMAFDLRLDGLTSFGGHKPRAIVAAAAPTRQLLELQAEHERLMQRVGLEPEGRKFTPHVTLARLRNTSSRDVADYLATPAISLGTIPRHALRALLVARIGRRRTLRRRGELSARRLTAAQEARLRIEHGGRKAMTVRDRFPPDRHRRRERRLDLADDAAEIKRQIGVEFSRQLLHAPVVGKARHVQQLDAAIARRENCPLKQRRADAVALPRLFDRNRSLRAVGGRCAEHAHFGRAAQFAVDEEAMHDRVEAEGQVDEIGDELIGDAAAETVAPAFRVEPEQVVAVFMGLADPQFADHAAVDQDISHSARSLRMRPAPLPARTANRTI